MAVTVDNIKNKTALVTGGAKRIGRTIVLALAKSGVDVVVHYNNSGRDADDTVSEAAALGVRAWKIRADLSNGDAVRALIPEALNTAGRLDFLVNNASIFPESRLDDLDPDDLRATLDINAVTPLTLAGHFARSTAEGCIVNLLDSRIERLDMNHVAYQLSKNMLHTLTGMMAVAYAPGIRVNGVAPGLILPPTDIDVSYIKRRGVKTLLGRQGSPENIADAVLFLVSNDFVTGQVVIVDGGENIKRSSYGD